MISFRENAGGVSFAVRVHSRAKKNGVTGEIGEAVKLTVTAAPSAGEANAACIELLAKVLNVPRSSVRIIAGQSSRNKVVHVTGVSAREVEERLRAAMA
jgi:uncharacterized protein (TIGR00251 family)